MKRCPNCNGSIIRLGNKEKPFLCKTCNKWFSNKEVTPKQTNADRIRSMTDEELAEWFGNMIYPECVCCPADNDGWCEDCKTKWLDWLKQEVADA